MTRLSRVFQFLLIEDNKNCSRNPHNYPSVMSQVYTLSPGLKYTFLFDGNSLLSFLQFPSTAISKSVILSIELLQWLAAILGFPHFGFHYFECLLFECLCYPMLLLIMFFCSSHALNSCFSLCSSGLST